MAKLRLDQLLVERGLAEDLKSAAAKIMRGLVRVDGDRVDKAGAQIDRTAKIEMAPVARYVSRGGLKLEAALSAAGVDPGDKVCLDLGASTGGFTDCLLQHGARLVYAFDVGRGQLDWSLRQDPRVVVREEVNVRYLKPGDLERRPDLITIDLSFISLRLVLPVLKPFRKADILALVKPQFEAPKEDVEPGGVVRNPETRRRVLDGIIEFVREEGFELCAAIPSPVTGAKGNREIFLHLRC